MTCLLHRSVIGNQATIQYVAVAGITTAVMADRGVATAENFLSPTSHLQGGVAYRSTQRHGISK